MLDCIESKVQLCFIIFILAGLDSERKKKKKKKRTKRNQTEPTTDEESYDTPDTMPSSFPPPQFSQPPLRAQNYSPPPQQRSLIKPSKSPRLEPLEEPENGENDCKFVCEQMD